MAERRISRRDFLSGVAAVGALPVLWPGDAFAQNGPPPPLNVRLAYPAAAPGLGGNRQLLGGWRLNQDFARGVIAIDFDRMKLWMSGHAQTQNILEYNLPPMGGGASVNAWPQVNPVRTIPGWWPNVQGVYCNGLCFWRGKLWATIRIFYAQNEQVFQTLTLYAEDGEKIVLPLVTQKFSGFVKRGPGLDPFIGCGGYDSGQGTQSGPSLATLAGQIRIMYSWPQLPGANLENWNQRAPRDPNYFPAGHVDSWMGWEPRVVNGTLQGRWASDAIYGGGLALPEGITYWPIMGTGDLDYARQALCFADPAKLRNYEYRYDPNTFQLIGYQARPDLDAWSSIVRGQELGPDGKVYLAQDNQWEVSHVAVKVFG